MLDRYFATHTGKRFWFVQLRLLASIAFPSFVADLEHTLAHRNSDASQSFRHFTVAFRFHFHRICSNRKPSESRGQ